ncbi:hypothetical protein ACA910_006403 [Epithemia clementina (nom. ined.)]
MPHLLPEGENATPLEVIGKTLTSGASDQLVLIMVGLPATGKTHIAKRICRFLSFFHDIPSQIFNVGDYRRRLFGAQQPAEFYNPQNPKGRAARQEACNAALADLIEYMMSSSSSERTASTSSSSMTSTTSLSTTPGQDLVPVQEGNTTPAPPRPRGRGRGGEARVAAFDATNTTQARRRHVLETLQKSGLNCKVMFVESICDQEELLEENIRKVKLATPDYRNMDPESAVQDFRRRRANYMSVYEPVAESEGPFIKIINSRQFIVTDIRGYLPLKVVHFLMNLHTLPRTFYLTRHGQSHYNLLGKIGGDSGLTPNGIEYAKRLAKFCKEYIAVDHRSDEEEEEEGQRDIFHSKRHMMAASLVNGNDPHNHHQTVTTCTSAIVANETNNTSTTITTDVSAIVRNHSYHNNNNNNNNNNMTTTTTTTTDETDGSEQKQQEPPPQAVQHIVSTEVVPSTNGDSNSTNGTCTVTTTTTTITDKTETGSTTLKPRPARLWTSTLRRTKETAQFIEHNTIHYTWDNGDSGEWVQFRPMERRNLDELYAGTCDGMTYKEIEQVFPEEFQRRQHDKLTYRYPRGESYMDVTLRLEPLAQEMERTREPVLIIGHQGILRILYAYFMGLDRKHAPYVSIPLNYVIELSPHAYGCEEHRYCLMHKEEMIHSDDGQDEPITSMPMSSSFMSALNSKYYYQGNNNNNNNNNTSNPHSQDYNHHDTSFDHRNYNTLEETNHNNQDSDFNGNNNNGNDTTTAPSPSHHHPHHHHHHHARQPSLVVMPSPNDPVLNAPSH